MEIKAANAEETIRCILDEEKMTQQDLADRMGKMHPLTQHLVSGGLFYFT